MPCAISRRFRTAGLGTSPEDFAAFIKAETVKWTRVVKEAGIEPE